MENRASLRIKYHFLNLANYGMNIFIMVIDTYLCNQLLLRETSFDEHLQSSSLLNYQSRSFYLNASKIVLDLSHVLIVIFVYFHVFSIVT